MRSRLRLTLLAVLLGGSIAAIGGAQEEDEESPYRPGLIAAYSTAESAAATRIDETVAFDWQDAAPDPRLAGGAFQATWRGRLWTQSPGLHRLAVFVQGQVSLKLGGKEVIAGTAVEPQWLVSAELDLPFDNHPLEITYRRSGQGGRLAIYWTGPNFVLEPIPERFLFHDRDLSPSSAFERGRQLAAALRCAACHPDGSIAAMPAPALDRLSGNINREWLVEWLSSTRGREGEAAGEEAGNGGQETTITRRMPHFRLTNEEASAIADWLLRLPATTVGAVEQKDAKDAKTDGKGKGKSGNETKSQPAAEAGEQLFLTLGCLACHQHGSLGEGGLFGGGDLTNIAAKRPPEYFARWLADPASQNKHHRMPVFDLSVDERTSLSLWLAQQGAVRNALHGVPPGDAAIGEKLVQQFRCAACHMLPGVKESPQANIAKPLAAASDWNRSCAGEIDANAHRPGYRLGDDDRLALKTYFSSAIPVAVPGTPRRAFPTAPQLAGRDLLVQLNCLSCHQREGIDRQVNLLPARLQDKLLAVAEAHSELAKQIPAMTPPALNSIGDKLHDAALADAISRKGSPHRPYLLVRMPKFNLTDEQLTALTAYFTSTDRISRGAGVSPARDSAALTPAPSLAAAGPRLVTTDGFGCTSCHQVGSVQADKAPINARGPNLSLLDKRIRREWFDRWCYSPARIVPRMEMPSVQVPVRGVLGDNVHDQLAAVWHTLNTPGFEPPEPNPIRVLRLSGVPERKESPIVLHDVVKDDDKTYLFPLVIGLPNRHNILFDLETNRLAAWWLGDTARQRTKGKSWYWEIGAKPLPLPTSVQSEITLVVAGKEYAPHIFRQHPTVRLDGYSFAQEGAILRYRVAFDLADEKSGERTRTIELSVVQTVAPLNDTNRAGMRSGLTRTFEISNAPRDIQIRLRLAPKTDSADVWDTVNRNLRIAGIGEVILDSRHSMRWNGDGTLDLQGAGPTAKENAAQTFRFALQYRTEIPNDQYLIEALPSFPVDTSEVAIAPGFFGQRLPLTPDIMPSALAWTADGTLAFCTLKGQIISASDSNADGLEDDQTLLVDGLATPYGLLADNRILVATKTRLVSVSIDADGRTNAGTFASGWGVTDDYHDWVVGLLRGEFGEHYVALPCQQDERSPISARHRGQVLKIAEIDDPEGPPLRKTRPQKSGTLRPESRPSLNLYPVSSGHRFPMGLAMNRAGDLFVTDNQGNYNPFNELNHVRPGKHFGFINANEKEAGFKPPPLEEPAINIPHPWTRSVNGICFLDTPVGWDKDASSRPQAHQNGANDGGPAAAAALSHPTSAFGPLEGHLIGCEYDTRRLIRMTLQKIGDTYQGAAYPLSIPPDDVEKGLLGPIVCAVKPTTGELYVGEIRDSGWGAGNNVGQIVKIKIEPEKLPCGIAEMRATADGFTLDFFQPVDAKKAVDAANYSLQSYRRESTPAYGGPDLDRRTEKIAAIEVSPDKKRVTLKLPEMRERFVYELRLKNLAPKNAMFHPDEAHFTLRQVPK